MKRRHWYDHEKLEIIKAHDAGVLKPLGSLSVEDPKSGGELLLTVIEEWRDQFKKLGIKVPDRPPKTKLQRPLGPKTIEDLLIDEEILLKALIENKRIQESLRTRKQERGSESSLPN